MASLSSLFLGGGAFFFLLATIVSVYTHIYETSDNANSGAAATTHLHFYMHDEYTGPRPTAMRVVSGRSLLPPASSFDNDDDCENTKAANETSPSSSSSAGRRQFGDIVVLNNALTEGPSIESARVGTAQGFGVRVSEGGVVSHVTMHLVMDAGEHSGSSVTVSCRIDVEEKVRESVVVGGTGRFRFARGYMLTSNYDYDLGRGGVVEFDVYLLLN